MIIGRKLLSNNIKRFSNKYFKNSDTIQRYNRQFDVGYNVNIRDNFDIYKIVEQTKNNSYIERYFLTTDGKWNNRPVELIPIMMKAYNEQGITTYPVVFNSGIAYYREWMDNIKNLWSIPGYDMRSIIEESSVDTVCNIFSDICDDYPYVDHFDNLRISNITQRECDVIYKYVLETKDEINRRNLPYCFLINGFYGILPYVDMDTACSPITKLTYNSEYISSGILNKYSTPYRNYIYIDEIDIFRIIDKYNSNNNLNIILQPFNTDLYKYMLNDPHTDIHITGFKRFDNVGKLIDQDSCVRYMINRFTRIKTTNKTYDLKLKSLIEDFIFFLENGLFGLEDGIVQYEFIKTYNEEIIFIFKTEGGKAYVIWMDLILLALSTQTLGNTKYDQ